MGNNHDSKILQVVGESLPAIVRGEVKILDIFMKNNTLSRFYEETLGIGAYLAELGRIAGSIGNKYPHINVLEIGSSFLGLLTGVKV